MKDAVALRASGLIILSVLVRFVPRGCGGAADTPVDAPADEPAQESETGSNTAEPDTADSSAAEPVTFDPSTAEPEDKPMGERYEEGVPRLPRPRPVRGPCR